MEDVIFKANILHIVNRQKFTSGYINFMKIKMKEYQHTFLVLEGKPDLDIVDEDNVVILKSYSQLLTEKRIRKEIRQCDKIIISGVFGAEVFMIFYSKKIWEKVYLHFWGRDFYFFRECPTIKRKVRKRIMGEAVKRATVLNLIPHDFEALKEVFPGADRHMVAAMPGNPQRQLDFKRFRNVPKKDDIIRIAIGNSAAVENQHLEIFEYLKGKITENIEIYCILSYGSMEYREQVIAEGRKCFGKQFIPITEYMEREDYLEFLSKLDIGIYNNNRQQGMGNIRIMASAGNKVYLRNDTTMWNYYKDIGYIFNCVNELKDSTIEEIISFDERIKENNCAVADTINIEMHVKQWEKVLEDKRA